MPLKVKLENIAIVLQQPKYPENIGSAARAMRNMGIRELIVVNPDNLDMDKVLKLATHEAADIIEAMKVHSDLVEALAPFNYVAGTTARLGGERQVVNKPAKLARQLIPISQDNKIAILFGSESRGLINEDIRLCHALVNIPTNDFSSLNLAQAVMVMCYELFQASTEENLSFSPRLANRFELDNMYEQLKDVLIKISYMQPDNPDYFMKNFRQFFTRLQLRAKEVGIIRGVCRQINWYGEKRYKDGLEEKDKCTTP
ncbi:MAG: RNA methyltransferase [Desulfobacterales bacterium]|nr:RNA methyltransferase [Desulfobacterales bacterium]